MRKYLFLLSCLLLLSGGLFAQSTEPDKSKAVPEVTAKNTVPDESTQEEGPGVQSVMAAASEYLPSDYASLAAQNPTMERRVNSSVDYYTGTANVNVLLHTISSYGLEIPVALQYAATGLKVDTYPTWVGLNWKLTGTGRITRIVNGQPDETGFLSGHGATAANSNAADWKSSAISTKMNEHFDGEPDLYYFELPSGQTGMFVINYDKTITLIPYQDFKVEWMNNSIYTDSYFVITDAQGIKYYFGSTVDSREKTYNKEYERTKTYVSGWMLDYITYGGKEVARYAYRTGQAFEKNVWNYLYRFEFKPSTNAHKSLSTLPMNLLTTIYPKVLTSITWELGKLEFDATDASDYVRTGPYLNAIRAYGYNNQYIKTINFEHGYSATTIDRIYETSGNLKKTICSFQYFYSPANFPNGGTNSIDYWGYYNASPITGPSSPEHTIMGYRVAGMPRTPNLESTKYRSLQKIIYPTGGWTEFEYELHQGRLPTPNIQSEWNGPLETAGGLRIKSITHYESADAVVNKTQYVYQDPTNTLRGGQIYSSYKPYPRIRKDSGSGSSRVVIYSMTKRPDFQMTDFTGASVVYNYVKEVLPNGSYNTYEFNSFDYSMDVKGEAALSTSGGIGAYVSDTQDKVSYSTKFFSRGLLNKKAQYSSSNQMIYSEAYTYEYYAPQKSAVYSYPLFATNEEGSVNYYKGRFQWISQPVVLTKKTVSGPDIPRYEAVYSYHPTYDDLMPRAMSETDAMWNYYRTTITYPQDYTVNAAINLSDETYGLYWLKSNGIKSVPVETIKYKKNSDASDYNVVGGTLNVYKWSSVAQKCLLSQTKTLLVNTPLGTGITPLSVNGASLIKDSRYDQYSPQTIDFNEKGNPTFTTYAGSNGKGTHIMYGFNGHVPVAYVKSAINSASDFYTSFEEETSNVAVLLGNHAKSGDYALNKNTSYSAYANPIGGPHVISYWRWNGVDGTDWEEVRASTYGTYTILEPNHYVDEVRILPPGASMTTQVVKPGIGVISSVDERGRSIRFNYNSLNMLESIEDEGQTVEKHTYIDQAELYNLSASVASGSSGRGQASVSSAQVSSGGSAIFTATPNPGYKFSQWQFSDGTNSTSAVTVKNDIRFDLSGTASFNEILYNLSASVASGSSGRGQVAVSVAQVGAGGSATWSATASSGYAFDYWVFSDGTTAYSSVFTKTGISNDITGTAYFKELGPEPVDFWGTIMPQDGYWAIRISCSPDIISDGSGRVSVSGYFFINLDTPEKDVVPFNGVVNENGYILSNAAFDENSMVGELSGQIFISDSNYKVGTVSWH